MRRDLALALSTRWPPHVIEALPDRVKETLWDLLEETKDRQGG